VSTFASDAAEDATSHDAQPERRASWLELFFDLCFVVAVGAVAHTLHDNPTRAGVILFAALFIPVWWSWMQYAWYATSFPEGGNFNRIAALAAMLTVLAMAAQVPQASHGDPRGVIFAFVAVHLIVAALFLRTVSLYPARAPFAIRYAIGFGSAALLWLGSLAVPEAIRPGIWAIALLVDLATPWLAVRAVPDRVYDLAHIPERYGLFTIIVLGEAIIAVARGTAESDWTPGAISAAVAGFALAALIWWSYFGHEEKVLLERGRLQAFIWGYGHVFVWAGIAMIGVGTEFAIEAANAGHGFPLLERLILCGGLALYLAAMAIIHATGVGWLSDPIAVARLVNAAAVLIIGIVGGNLAPEALISTIAAVTIGTRFVAARPRRAPPVPA
jgi:low temperature requirement protein LtrA